MKIQNTDDLVVGNKDWLANYLNANLSYDTLEPYITFFLYWNVFEARLFERNFHSSYLRNDKLTIKVDEKTVSRTLSEMKRRYQSEDKFQKLGFRNTLKDKSKETEDEKYVKDVLDGAKTTLQERINAILIVIYRYRNNLFHGEKRLNNARRQTGILKLATRFLGECLRQNPMY